LEHAEENKQKEQEDDRYSGVPGSEKYPIVRIVRSLQQNLSTSTLLPFNHKQNYSNYITVTIMHPVTWGQLFNIQQRRRQRRAHPQQWP